MAAQDVRELIPRVQRAVYGPDVPTSGALSEAQLAAMAADAIADVILMTTGQWGHTLDVTARDATSNFPTEWAVDPALSLEEESVIAAQAALTYFFHTVKSQKVSERIVHEGREWEYTISANVLRDQIKLLIDQRNMALDALKFSNPVMARYASILHVRDALGAAMLEPWRDGGLGGGQILLPAATP
jgi:hypothetical protein